MGVGKRDGANVELSVKKYGLCLESNVWKQCVVTDWMH